MTKTVLLAGLLGGLLGGAASFAANRFIKPVEPAKPSNEQLPNGSRDVADAYVAKLKAAKFDEFAIDAKTGVMFLSDEQFQAFKTNLNDSRIVYANKLGPSSGEFEFVRETTISPSLSRFVYLEKFERGAVMWIFVLYKSKDKWRLAWVEYGIQLQNIFSGLS